MANLSRGWGSTGGQSHLIGVKKSCSSTGEGLKETHERTKSSSREPSGGWWMCAISQLRQGCHPTCVDGAFKTRENRRSERLKQTKICADRVVWVYPIRDRRRPCDSCNMTSISQIYGEIKGAGVTAHMGSQNSAIITHRMAA